MNPAEAAHGPGLIGAFLNVFLFGIMVAQAFYYFSTYKKDRLWIKIYVAFLVLADLLNSIFDIYWLYHDIIINFGNLDNLAIAAWPLAADPAMVAIIATFVQLFFAWRVRVLTNSWWITSLILVTAFVSCCGGLGVAIAIHFVKYYENFDKFDQVGTIWLISTAVCDSAIAISLTWHLRRHKTGFQHTDDVLNRIIRLTVSNGALTAVWAIVDLILFLSIKTGVHLALNLPLAKLYTNSLMSSLNSRAGWKFTTKSDGADSSRATGQPAKSAAMPEFLHLSTAAATHQEVMVHVESHEMTDVEVDRKWPLESRSGGPEVYKTPDMV
ncbi:hypothetical protein PsYK624_097110 [Phanerochaete sordida]|uniref:DUF6534 domain-containing protein n=1 Tax=Phanerochaete sordida TaxID=48140 RepID=A0A9P3LGY4_9APHY|nr:hypothetical protein PsYK624_097110 [Phanerochaete sordida]